MASFPDINKLKEAAGMGNAAGGFFDQSRTAGNDFENNPERSRARATSSQATPRELNKRARKALRFGMRMIAGFIWWEMAAVKVIGRERVDASRINRFIKLARDYRTLALDLGGVWIKLGQFLSSRVDIIPPQVIVELQGLQDAVPPEPAHVIQPIIEKNLGKPLSELFEEFDPEPIAAASFGQAHLALLKGRTTENKELTRRVIVKVQRPNLDAIVNTDIKSLKTILKWLRNYKPIRRRANLDALADEFAGVIYEELDYEQEAKNAEIFARNFANDASIRVPKAYLSSKRVLVLENVEEIKITDFEGLESAGIRRDEVAHKLFESYLEQIFQDGFFHADPHPGNLFVQPVDDAQAKMLGMSPVVLPSSQTGLANGAPQNGLLPSIPFFSGLVNALTSPSPKQMPIASRPPVANGRPFRLIYIDFGMVGRVTPANMRELKEFIIATGTKDVRRLTAAAQRMGFFTPEADTLRIEQAIGGLFERVWGMNMNDLTNVDFDEMYSFAVQFKDLLSSLPFQIPQNVLYLGRATNILSGMCTALDARFNPWSALQPFAQGMAGNSNIAPTPQDLFAELLRIGRLAVQLPGQADNYLSRALNGQMEMRAQLSPASTNELKRIETSVSRLTWALVMLALLGCGTVLLLNSFAVLGAISLAAAVLALVRLATLG